MSLTQTIIQAPKADDIEVLDRARQGEEDAFRRLVERHQQKAYATALAIVRDRDDAHDVCQEAFLRVHRSLPTFDGESRFSTWLFRIVYNLSIDLLRRRRSKEVSIDEAGGLAANSAEPLSGLASEQLRARIQEALEQLSPAHRAVITLREMEELSYKEIADVVGCSMGTVMSRLFHARKNLEKALRADKSAMELIEHAQGIEFPLVA